MNVFVARHALRLLPCLQVAETLSPDIVELMKGGWCLERAPGL